MDLPLWDSSDDQGYLTSFAYESGSNTEDHLLHVCFGYGRDMLEEDALNEKSCLQVLKIWIDKADEDIVKLEEDILMLKCQLVWDDKDWSEQCSAALREKIDHLDNLIQSMKENRDNGFRVESEELPPRLHDLLKPLLENYLAKPKQTETSTVQTLVSTAVELSSKKSEFSTSKDCQITEENVQTPISTGVLKTYERKSKSTELEEREINHPQEKQNAVTAEIDASAHTCPNDEVSENFISKPITPDGRSIPNLVHAESERSPDQPDVQPADSVVKESNTSTSIEKVNSGEKEEKSNNLSTTPSKPGVIPVMHQYQSNVTHLHLTLNKTGSPISETIEGGSMKPRTEASSKVRKARVYRRSTKEDGLSVKPSVKMKGKKTKFSETSEAVEALDTEMKISPCSIDDRTEHVKKPRMELEHQAQVQQRRDIDPLNVNQAKLTSPFKPEGQRPQKKCKENPEAAEALETKLTKKPRSMNDRTERVKKSTSGLEHQIQVQRRDIETAAVNQAKLISAMKPEGRGAQKKCKEIPEILQNSSEAEHVDKGPSSKENLIKTHVADTSVIAATPILSPQEVKRLSFTPQTTYTKDYLTSSGMKLAKKEVVVPSSTTEEATDGAKNKARISTLCVRNHKAKLTCSYLREIAKSQKLRGYYKLKKEELLKRLGFQ